MSFSPAPALEVRQPSGTGISCALRVSKGGRRTFMLLMTAAAMQRLFGEDVAGRSAVLLVGRAADEGKVRLILEGGEVSDWSGGFPFTIARGVRGTGVLRCGGWDLLPADKRTGSEVRILAYSGNGTADLLLPSWARPSRPDGKLGQEFALKPVPRAPGQDR